MRDASLAIELNARGQATKGHKLTTVYANMWKPSQFCRAEAKRSIALHIQVTRVWMVGRQRIGMILQQRFFILVVDH